MNGRSLLELSFLEVHRKDLISVDLVVGSGPVNWSVVNDLADEWLKSVSRELWGISPIIYLEKREDYDKFFALLEILGNLDRLTINATTGGLLLSEWFLTNGLATETSIAKAAPFVKSR